MTTFTLIILIIFVGMLAGQFIAAIERNYLGLAALSSLEIMTFVYLAKILM